MQPSSAVPRTLALVDQSPVCRPRTLLTPFRDEDAQGWDFDGQPVLSVTNSVAQKPEGSSPHSQQPATDACPEPVESNPHLPSQSP
jgi:hypothetical protein